MRVRFPRLADGQRSFSVVERSDGVRYRVHEGVAGPALPHDAVHFVVERETEEDGGFWGAVAAGAVFSSMRHIDGRRPPHAKERSESAIRARSERLQRAELMADLVEYVAAEGITSAGGVAKAAREVLSTLPDTSVDGPKVIAAAATLQATARRWASLAPGDELTFDWPEKRRR
ncbi:hypothetical protein GCM10027176_48230 [Actinoallomurus bryophytorum]|uniref:Uncharacterized protein n=1 Tax=Actinoallomurus bryophytorum TaxID=1490222 RepID=A0A543CKC8_9ACTN|nr:hypothetical protein [Actinoallomurus bryophytorum]TQL97554.1 hypothetical protein FB559_3147 [Actinoallomurus bryophytorum]